MKKLLFPFFLLSSFSTLFSQKVIQPVSAADYDRLKSTGKLDPAVQYIPIQDKSTVQNNLLNKAISPLPKPDSTGTCSCMVPVDATFTVAPFSGGIAPDYRNDDYSTGVISIPFSFCLYGTNYSSLYINNNGNISFGAASGVFSSTGFPNNSDVMVAPFWSDVDTRNLTSGLVYYKTTPTHMIVKWESVGYYAQHVDKLCTFQLIITNGSDPILPSGNNIAFCYGDMDWTTGDASQGVNGFGGVPATVGINKGNGVNYIQIGLYDMAGVAYDGPGGNTDGVDWLDYKSFYFDACGSATNLPPISTTNSACGDTITICGLSDTLILNSVFIAPENNQSTTITASAPTLGSNFTILNNQSGTTGQITFMVIGAPGLAGYHNITITATDNGTPALSTTATYVVSIVNNPIPDPVVTVSPQPACAASNPTLTLVNCSSYDTYVWSNGNTNCNFSTTTPGQYWVTVSDSGCYKTSFANAVILANPVPVINGALSYCNGSGTTLNVLPGANDASPYTSMIWNPGSISNDTLYNALAGTHSVTVTDTNGCVGTTSVVVNTNNPTVTISANPTNLCPGDTTTLTASIAGGTYAWNPNNGTSQSIPAFNNGPYTVTVTANGCTATTTFNLQSSPSPTVSISGTTAFCQGSTTTLSATSLPAGTYTYNWSTGTAGSSIIHSATGNVYVVGTNNTTGCSDTAAVTITVNANPSVVLTAANNNVICVGSAVAVSATASGGTPAYSYSWTPNLGTGSTVNAVNAGTYTVAVTDANGCSGTSSIGLTTSNPIATLSASDSTICPGQCEFLFATGASNSPVTFSWLPSNPSVNDTLSFCSDGLYSVIVTDANNCSDTASLLITENPVPVADFAFLPSPPQQPNVPIYFSDSSYITTGSIISWDWSFGDGDTSVVQNPVHSYTVGGTFPVSLIVTASNGCEDTLTMFYTIDVQVYAPNIITPNNDGKNDALYFRGLEYYPNNKIAIFNRWGQKIYDKESYSNDWNGTGQNDGTYYYILEVPNARPQTTFTSYFTIIR
jgi:gliding motility-associated-like protein